jgi:phosphoglycerate dehydrogenase-like enzyme
LGCGDIGTSVAKAARAFGMRTVGYGKTSRNADPTVNGIDTFTTNLAEALQAADYIVSVLPSTHETRGLLNNDAFLPASKRSGGKCPVFLNVGRGDIISEDSLLNALDNRWISAAILDVFAVEPLAVESALWGRSDIVVSPHVSGLTQGKDVPKVFMENYVRFLKDEELKYSVNWENVYVYAFLPHARMERKRAFLFPLALILSFA